MRWNTLVALVALVACNGPEVPRGPQQPVDTTAAVGALRQASFADASREATAALAHDPKSSTAAAVRAVARYQLAVDKVIKGKLGEMIDKAEGVKSFDHEKGRASWRQLLGELEAVDRDLAIVAADPAFSLELCIACWKVDWNRNGRIDERDGKMLELEFDGKGGELAEGDPRRRPTYRFDAGDALWARAMISFQRSAVEIVLAYRWSELDKLFLGADGQRITIKLVDAGRVKHARELIVAGLGFAEGTRQAYLAETDDDREWVPNPTQKSYAMPLEVDAKLYETWGAVIGDVHRMLASQEGLSMREAAALLLGKEDAQELPNAYVDLGRMLREPTDIVLDLHDGPDKPDDAVRVAKGLLGRGYVESMRPTPLVARLRHMREELERGEDTLERKLRYLIWLN